MTLKGDQFNDLDSAVIRVVLAALFFAALLPGLAHACCAIPIRNAGDVIYNADYHTVQHRDGNN
jgi:hypothetical protein